MAGPRYLGEQSASTARRLVSGSGTTHRAPPPSQTSLDASDWRTQGLYSERTGVSPKRGSMRRS
jgi:hypothetical protein